MEQLPKVPYGIVGSGRAARHFAHYFELIHVPYRQWSRRDPVTVETALAGCEKILLLISDDAIEGFIHDHPELGRAKLIHASGARTFSGAVKAHPLMSFGLELLDLSTYSRMLFTIDPEETKDLHEIYPEFTNPYLSMTKQNQALYHALCVVAGNFPVLLWGEAEKNFRSLGVIHDHLAPYLETVLKNFLAHGGLSLTGPLARGDQGTIRRNLGALAGTPLRDVYSSFVKLVSAKEKACPPDLRL